MLGNPFTPDHIKGLLEVQTAFSKLEKFGNIWIGSDIALEKPINIKPGELIRGAKIVINKNSLPGLDINRGVLKLLGLSVRSFYAQTGINISFHADNVSDEMLRDIKSGKDTLIPIDINNLGQRSVEVEGKVMRFFWANDRKRLRGKDLVNKIKTGDFFVDGVEGEDWYLGGYNDNDKLTTKSDGTENSLCVVIRLKPEKFYIPDSPNPVKKNNSLGTRENLAGLLKPIPAGVNVNFEIGETPRVKFGPNIVGVINTGWSDEGQRHINSPLIDPGFDWPIRTETLYGLKYVEFFLYEK